MKISKITGDEKDKNVFYVSFEPNWLENIFGVSSKVVKYKATGYIFDLSKRREYLIENGGITTPSDEVALAIDNFRRFNE